MSWMNRWVKQIRRRGYWSRKNWILSGCKRQTANLCFRTSERMGIGKIIGIGKKKEFSKLDTAEAACQIWDKTKVGCWKSQHDMLQHDRPPISAWMSLIREKEVSFMEILNSWDSRHETCTAKGGVCLIDNEISHEMFQYCQPAEI